MIKLRHTLEIQGDFKWLNGQDRNNVREVFALHSFLMCSSLISTGKARTRRTLGHVWPTRKAVHRTRFSKYAKSDLNLIRDAQHRISSAMESSEVLLRVDLGLD